MHPWHASVAILGFALIYLGVGTLIGAVIASPLEGSLASPSPSSSTSSRDRA